MKKCGCPPDAGPLPNFRSEILWKGDGKLLNPSFPVRESTIFSISEFTARALGLLFLAKFVALFGLDSSGLFRTVLPVIGIACAIGSVGVPQAITRLVSASDVQARHTLYRDHLSITAETTAVSMGITTAVLLSLIQLSRIGHIGDTDMIRLLLISVPLLLVTCISGATRAILLGMGMNFVTAASQILEASVRLALVIAAAAEPIKRLDFSGAEAGIYMITTSETMALLFLVAVFGFSLYTKRLRVTYRPVSLRYRLQTWWSILRMSISPTTQSLLASAGYALELPLAEHFLALQFGEHQAEALVAEYAAVAIPLLCAPMFVTDGMATALLPALTAQRAQRGRASLSAALFSTIRAVAMMSIPVSAGLCILAPVLCRWFGAGHASLLLCWLAPLALPLYLQAPLASILQAQGRGRALLYASLFGDLVRISSLYICLGPFHLAEFGLALACAISVVSQTLVLLTMALRMSPISAPWITLCHSLLCSVVVGAVCLLGLHVRHALGFEQAPWVWLALAVSAGAFYLFVAGEITPATLGSLPVVGSRLRQIAELGLRRVNE